MNLGLTGSATTSGHGEAGLLLQPTCMIVEDQALIGFALEAYTKGREE